VYLNGIKNIKFHNIRLEYRNLTSNKSDHNRFYSTYIEVS